MRINKFFQVITVIIGAFTSLIAVAVIFKPPVLLDPIKNLLNAPYSSFPIEYGQNRINIEQLITTDSGSVEFTEEQLYNLLNDKLPQLHISRIEFQDNRILLFRNIATSGTPLWLIAEISIIEGEYKLISLGFGSIRLPSFMHESAINWLNSKFLNNSLAASSWQQIMGKGYSLIFNPKYVKIVEDQIQVKLVDIDNTTLQQAIDNINPKKYNAGIEKTIEDISNTIKNFSQ